MNFSYGRGYKQASFLSTLSLLASFSAALNSETTCIGCPLNADENSPYSKYKHWEDAPASWEEYGHDNDESVCGVPRLTVEQWEKGKWWQKNKPVIVMNVTEQWPAVEHWKKEEMLKRYFDAEATMGEARLLGETGPDDAGHTLTPTTVGTFITQHMYDPLKYFFDRKLRAPQGMLDDCHPYPQPTRAYLKDEMAYAIEAPSHKRKVDPRDDIWRDHLAISIGKDLTGLSFHHHGPAWNVVIFGAKRWILWDHNRFKNNMTRQLRIVRPLDDAELEDRVPPSDVRSHVLSSPEWIKYLYPSPERQEEIRAHGHDCIQRAGELMFVPRRWMHSVINIGDTVSVISEVGHVKGEGKAEEDFAYDPYESSDDDEEDHNEEGLSTEEKIRRRGPPPQWLCADQNPNHPACIFCAKNPDNPVCGDGFIDEDSSSSDDSFDE